MKFSSLPHVVLARLVDLDARLAELMTAAAEADALLARAREVVNGKDNSVSAEELMRERLGFDATHAAAKLARARAEMQRKVLSEAKRWVEGLPPGSQLSIVQPAASDLDLAALRERLAGLREELRQLDGNSPAAADIGQKIDAYVAGLAALPQVRGFGPGQPLDVRWGGDNFDANRSPALLLFAALLPRELAGLLLQAVKQAQPLSQAEHAARRSELKHAIDELSYVVATLLEQAGAPPDDKMRPWHVLGVRLDQPQAEGAAAA